MKKHLEAETPKITIPSIDLREVTRNPKKLCTAIDLQVNWKDKIDRWILVGEAKFNNELKDGRATIAGYFSKNVTDHEHSSAYAIQFQVVGLTFKHLWYHTAHFQAWIDPNDPESFHIPKPGYDPAKIAGVETCTDPHCEDKPHLILPDGYYVPKFERELWEFVKGKPIEIHVGPA